jgi:two-component system LytT family response regulator
MWRVLIVDDERLARLALRSLLEDRSDVAVIGEADSVASARDMLQSLRPDVIFLDVQMPGGSGFELVQPDIEAKVVFCTAYEPYAVRAFEVNALDYLVKPAGPEQVERALRRLGQAAPPVAAPAVPHAVPIDASGPLRVDDFVLLQEAKRARFVRVREITHIQAADDYSDVHLRDGSHALVDVTLRRWEGRLPAQCFVRIHRSSLVNLGHIASLQQVEGHWRVLLREGAVLDVSRRMYGELKERLKLVSPP